MSDNRLPDVLLMERIALDKIWGGRALVERFGIDLPCIGETWECFDRGPTSSSRIRNHDATLHELSTARTEEILGAAALDEFGRFPLMLKYLDATQRLSLQVHPDDSLARELGQQDPGKTEAWYVLDAKDDAELICGFESSAAALCGALVDGDAAERMLHTRRARRGDVVAIPAGTVHAVGAGYVLYEIQQNSDITLRLHDWGRVGDDGNPRALHLEDGQRAIEAATSKIAPVDRPRVEDSGVERLVANDRFVLRRVRLDAMRRLHLGGTCALVTPVEGRVAFGSTALETLETGLVRAAVETLDLAPADDEAVLLVATPAEEDGFRLG